MAFEDLLRLQQYLRGDGRNYMAEAINRINKRRDESEERAEKRADVFESQRRSQEFQREEGALERTAREGLAEKQADAYLNRIKAMQEMKLRSAYPKKENETDEQWEERVGKTQAESVNRLLEDASDARKRAGGILKEQAKRKQGEVLKRARLDQSFLSTVESLDKKTATAIRGGASPEAAIQELAKKSKDKAAQALTAYEETVGKYAGTDDRGNPVLPDATPQAIDEYNSFKEAEKLASEQATLLINTYQRDGDFKGAPYLKSIARELLGPRVQPGAIPPPAADPLNFAPKKSSPGGNAGAGAPPALSPGAGSVGNAERGMRSAERGGVMRLDALPGAGLIPRGLNYLNENFEDPVAPIAGSVGRALAEPFTGAVTGLRNAGRFLFSGEPLEPYNLPRAGIDLPAGYARPSAGTPFGIAGVVPMPPPTAGPDLTQAMRGFQPVVDQRTPPLAMNVTANELHDYFLNELGMTPQQVAEHEEEKAQGNPEAIQSEREILSQIMRSRAMPPPMEPALMR